MYRPEIDVTNDRLDRKHQGGCHYEAVLLLSDMINNPQRLLWGVWLLC
jgi:hypothetical protein